MANELAKVIADSLESDRRATLRPSQRAPKGNWSIWLILAGRGFGKNYAGASWLLEAVEAGTARNIALVGATAADVRDTMVEGTSGILALSPSWNRPTYESSKRRITWPNGTNTLFSSEEPDRLRGPNHDLCWCDELCSWSNLQATWDMLQLTLRLGSHPRICISTTPRQSKLLKDLVSRRDADVVISSGSTFENRDNLAPMFLASIIKRYQGTRLGRQELEAELIEDVEGALWNRDRLDECRRSKAPEFKRIVVAIDPAISVSEDSDETGIIVAGLGVDGHGYILEDASGKYLPTEWASKAVNLYRKYEADRIVAEINQGGAMVESTIRTIAKNASYRAVTAKRGKMLRAEPISALYEQYRVHHVGTFLELEDQMCTYCGGGDSPDRLDAAVYALTDLMLGYQPVAVPICGPGIVEGFGRHNPFGPVGPNPFSDAHVNSDYARCDADKRTSGFTIRY